VRAARRARHLHRDLADRLAAAAGDRLRDPAARRHRADRGDHPARTRRRSLARPAGLGDGPVRDLPAGGGDPARADARQPRRRQAGGLLVLDGRLRHRGRRSGRLAAARRHRPDRRRGDRRRRWRRHHGRAAGDARDRHGGKRAGGRRIRVRLLVAAGRSDGQDRSRRSDRRSGDALRRRPAGAAGAARGDRDRSQPGIGHGDQARLRVRRRIPPGRDQGVVHHPPRPRVASRRERRQLPGLAERDAEPDAARHRGCRGGNDEVRSPLQQDRRRHHLHRPLGRQRAAAAGAGAGGARRRRRRGPDRAAAGSEGGLARLRQRRGNGGAGDRNRRHRQRLGGDDAARRQADAGGAGTGADQVPALGGAAGRRRGAGRRRRRPRPGRAAALLGTACRGGTEAPPRPRPQRPAELPRNGTGRSDRRPHPRLRIRRQPPGTAATAARRRRPGARPAGPPRCRR
jgi:hypothetical protein